MQNEYDCILSIETLKIGYKLSMTKQTLKLENGTEWIVSNVSAKPPKFLRRDMLDSLVGDYDKSEDAFYFTLTEFVGYNQKLNPKTCQYENDFTQILPGKELFKLMLKRKDTNM